MPMISDIRYQIEPRRFARGSRWVHVHLQNRGEDELRALDVKLNSLDTGSIHVPNESQFVPSLAPAEEHEIHYRVSAVSSGDVYIAVEGRVGGEPFHWESPGVRIRVEDEVAELVSLLAEQAPAARLGEPIEVTATVRSLALTNGLGLEFWLETPSETVESLRKLPTERMRGGEEAQHSVDFTPESEGIYILHTYLFDGSRRIDHATEALSIGL